MSVSLLSRMAVPSSTDRWPRVPLAHICRIEAPIVDPKDLAFRDLPHVSGEDIEGGTGRLLALHSAADDGMTSGKYLFDAGVLLYSKLRPYLRKVAVADFRGLCSADMYPITFDAATVSLDYAKYVLLSEHFTAFAAAASARARMPKINREQLLAYRFPLPPLVEQERIATWLTAAMAEVEQARAAAQARLAAAEALPRAFVEAAFAEMDWPVRKLGDALDAIEAGTSVVSTERPAEDDEWGVLKVSAVSWGKFLPSENKGVPADYEPAPHERVTIGDLLISRCNTAELAGAVVLVRETPPKLMLSDKTLRLVLRPGIYEPAFLELALRTRAVRRFIEGRATGTSYSMRNISQETIRAIPVPTPPLTKQQHLVAVLGRETDEARNLIADVADELAMIQALPASLLRQAFGSTEGDDGEGA